MAPHNITNATEHDGDMLGLDQPEAPIESSTYKKRTDKVIVWRNVILFILLHIGALYGIVLIPKAMYQTLLWSVFMYFFAGLGITAGAHRLWSHRSYKARLPLRILLTIMNSAAFENSVIDWSRDHRVHHKFAETDADPHNIKRGFFFAHMGWLLVKKHPDVKEKGKLINVDDLKKDPLLVWQRRHYKKLVLLFCFIMPTLVPVILWGESAFLSFYIPAILRYTCDLHGTWFVNSAAHLWGNRPYDERIDAAENSFVAAVAIGEGFHNYHHVFPHDYSTSEHGWRLNGTTLFIDCMYYLGQAYDLRQISEDTITKRRLRTGVAPLIN